MELKPCPFCGKANTAEIISSHDEEEFLDSDEAFAVCCNFNNEGCGGSGGYRSNTEEAIKAWNQREKT